ncbi:MAG: hypothetical protein V9G04_11350 [Nocardioides sp.]
MEVVEGVAVLGEDDELARLTRSPSVVSALSWRIVDSSVHLRSVADVAHLLGGLGRGLRSSSSSAFELLDGLGRGGCVEQLFLDLLDFLGIEVVGVEVVERSSRGLGRRSRCR